MTTATPTLAIICGTNHLRRVECDRFVASVIDTCHDVDWTIYLGDVSPPEYTLYRHPHPRVRVFREWPRAGVSKGYNVLADHGKEEYITWANDDATYWRDYAMDFAEGYEEHEQPSSWALNAIRALQQQPAASCAVLPYWTPHPPYPLHANEFPAGLLYPNFGLFTRQTFERCGGFDPRVKMYGMDNALCFRMLNGSPDPEVPGEGGAMLFVPDARVVHHYAEDASRHKNMQRTPETHEPWMAVYREWQPHLERLQAVQRRIPPQPTTWETNLSYESMFGRRLDDVVPSEKQVVG